MDYGVAMSSLKKKQLMRIQMIAEEKEFCEEDVGIENNGEELDILKVMLKYVETNAGSLDKNKMGEIINELWAEIRE